ncbi:MAG: 2-dehydropantoate 2-reductase [Saprospirales bacterium]|nr:2-dehydropantoate 2-reductase [Saprospirales bacterium]
MHEPRIRKAGIIGMGPVGTILAVHLQEAGLEVGICDLDPVKGNLIRSNGVFLEGERSKRAYFKNIFGAIDDFETFQPDILIICLKTTQLAAAVREINRLSNSSLGVICAMNGIDVEQMASKILGESRTFRMVINFAGNLSAPNITKVTFFNPPNYIASLDDSRKEDADEIAALLDRVNLETKSISSFELVKRIWEKTILNASLSALCAVGRMTIKEAMSNSDTMELVEQTIQEAVEVAEAEKIKFEDDFIRKCLRYLHKAGNHFPSLAVDLLNHRPTEIDYMNGKIVEYGRKHYIRTSLNLTFTNMVKSMTDKNFSASLQSAKAAVAQSTIVKEMVPPRDRRSKAQRYFLGVDLGSAYIKFTVIDEYAKIVFQTALKTLNRDKISVRHVIEVLKGEYPVSRICATGYGRKHIIDADIVKTELNCAVLGVSHYFPGEKNILDIGGEDIKVIKCNAETNIENFYLNDKCAAGTGSFITEVAERADIAIAEMSDLAMKSAFRRELNSFCTVFAKTEIMSWLFEGMTVEDISKGIYISILNRIVKLRIDPLSPVYLIGGVIAHHFFLKNLLQEHYKTAITIVEKPQFTVSFGAALYARQAAGDDGAAAGQEPDPVAIEKTQI